jgi:hypothetical protein
VLVTENVISPAAADVTSGKTENSWSVTLTVVAAADGVVAAGAVVGVVAGVAVAAGPAQPARASAATVSKFPTMSCGLFMDAPSFAKINGAPPAIAEALRRVVP